VEARGTRAPDGVELVVDHDATQAGAAARAHLDAGVPVAGYVGDADDPAVAEFVTDVIRPAISRRRPSAAAPAQAPPSD
jgi:hypothetical protein